MWPAHGAIECADAESALVGYSGCGFHSACFQGQLVISPIIGTIIQGLVVVGQVVVCGVRSNLVCKLFFRRDGTYPRSDQVAFAAAPRPV